MPHSIESAPIVLIMKCLYKEPQRGSKIYDEIKAKSGLTYEHFGKLLLQLQTEQLIENIEKNKSNGHAVYKLTRAGEKILERYIHSQYESPCACGHENAAC
jgi:predicted transcriptional regulator